MEGFGEHPPEARLPPHGHPCPYALGRTPSEGSLPTKARGAILPQPRGCWRPGAPHCAAQCPTPPPKTPNPLPAMVVATHECGRVRQSTPLATTVSVRESGGKSSSVVGTASACTW